MKTLISIDPGMSTGLVVGTYSDDTPFELTHAFQIEGGVEGFLKEVRVHHGEDWGLNLYGSMWIGRDSFTLYEDEEVPNHPSGDNCDDDDCYCFSTVRTSATVLVEKFTARGAAAGPFALKTDALEPLRIEGALLAIGVPITWVSPAQQYFMPAESKAKKKQAQHKWLKENGFYIAPKDLGTKDADDARSALGHALAWLKRQKHKPTLELLLKGTK